MLPLRNNVGGLGYVYSEAHGGIVPRGPQVIRPSVTAVAPSAPSEQGALGFLNSDQTSAAAAGVAGPAAAAAAGVAGPAGKVAPAPGCRAIPQLSVIKTWVGLFKVMYVGTNLDPPLLDQEALHGYKWRPGAKIRWREVRIGWLEILRVAGNTDSLMSPSSLRRQYEQAAVTIDEERMLLGRDGSKMGFPSHLKKIIMPKYKQSGYIEHTARRPVQETKLVLK